MESRCINHDSAPAVSRCKLCLKPLCASCESRTDDGIFCSGDCMAKYKRAQSQMSDFKARDLAHKGKDKMENAKAILIKLIIWSLVIIAAIVAWYMVPLHTKKEMSHYVNQVLRAYGFKHH